MALYWIRNPGKSWKILVANRAKKVAEIVGEPGVVWQYCTTEKILIIVIIMITIIITITLLN